MNLRLNGELREFADGLTVAALLERLGLPARGLAVAVDGNVLPRSAHVDTELREGCAVEIIRAVGGG